MNYYDYNEADIVREYEMIWSLFQGKEEEEEPNLRSKDGISSKILNFLFGSASCESDDDGYREKRRYHRHIYEPSPRHQPPPGSAHSEAPRDRRWERKRLDPSSATPPPHECCQTSMKVLFGLTVASAIVLMTSASHFIHNLKSILNKKEENSQGESQSD